MRTLLFSACYKHRVRAFLPLRFLSLNRQDELKRHQSPHVTEHKTSGPGPPRHVSTQLSVKSEGVCHPGTFEDLGQKKLRAKSNFMFMGLHGSGTETSPVLFIHFIMANPRCRKAIGAGARTQGLLRSKAVGRSLSHILPPPRSSPAPFSFPCWLQQDLVDA